MLWICPKRVQRVEIRIGRLNTGAVMERARGNQNIRGGNCSLVRLELWNCARAQNEGAVLRDLERALPELKIDDDVWAVSFDLARRARAKGITPTRFAYPLRRNVLTSSALMNPAQVPACFIRSAIRLRRLKSSIALTIACRLVRALVKPMVSLRTESGISTVVFMIPLLTVLASKSPHFIIYECPELLVKKDHYCRQGSRTAFGSATEGHQRSSCL